MSLSNCGVSWSKLGALWSKKKIKGTGVPLDMLCWNFESCLKIGNLAGHESSIMLSAFHFSWYPQFPASPVPHDGNDPPTKSERNRAVCPKRFLGTWLRTSDEVREGHGMRLAMKCLWREEYKLYISMSSSTASKAFTQCNSNNPATSLRTAHLPDSSACPSSATHEGRWTWGLKRTIELGRRSPKPSGFFAEDWPDWLKIPPWNS